MIDPVDLACPPPPAGLDGSGPTWVDCLRWAAFVMDRDDRSLPFVASVLSYALQHEGCISSKQAAVCQDILERVRGAWSQGILARQLAADHPLIHAEPKGRA